jgi:hypothetical protein
MRMTTIGALAVLCFAWVSLSTAAPARHLTKKHTGWRKTACFECHDREAMARSHKPAPASPADCGSCHGYNGAPHEGHAVAINPCGSCHGKVAHAASFQTPGDCIKCHVHPKSPKGR